MVAETITVGSPAIFVAQSFEDLHGDLAPASIKEPTGE
jgi:hypothetical protein